jgi:multiple sugar transport system permease protein
MKSKKIDSQGAYWFLLPYFVLFFLFLLLPAVTILPMSLTSWNILGTPKFVGFSNYLRMFKDHYFWKATFNTFEYTILVTIGLTILALLLAILLNQKLKGRVIGRVFVLMPYVISSAAAGIVWKWMYDNNFGIINSYLSQIGLQPQPFLIDTTQAMLAIVFMNLWWSVGFNTIIYLAALQGIPQELYQAAQVDGANGWQTFRYITLPSLKPITLYVTVLCFANSFQMFDESYIMTQGGPVGSTTTLVFRMWNMAFQNFRFGDAAAVSMVIILFILAVTLLQFRIGRQKGEEA